MFVFTERSGPWMTVKVRIKMGRHTCGLTLHCNAVRSLAKLTNTI